MKLNPENTIAPIFLIALVIYILCMLYLMLKSSIISKYEEEKRNDPQIAIKKLEDRIAKLEHCVKTKYQPD